MEQALKTYSRLKTQADNLVTVLGNRQEMLYRMKTLRLSHTIEYKKRNDNLVQNCHFHFLFGRARKSIHHLGNFLFR